MPREVYAIVVQGQGVREVKRDFDGLGKSAGSAVDVLGFLRGALVALAGAAILQQFVAYVDVFTNMENRLKLVTGSTEELTAVQAELFRVSQSTRTSIESNTELFQRLTTSTLNLGLSYGELIGLTETVAKTLKISGATANEAEKAIRQLGQGLAAGAIRGDELVSVSEQLPALTNIIAKEFRPELEKLGVAVNGASLRTLNEAFKELKPGVITTARVVKALKDNAEEVDAAFAKLTPTITDGFTKLNNAVLTFLGNVNKTSGVGAIIDRKSVV